MSVIINTQIIYPTFVQFIDKKIEEYNKNLRMDDYSDLIIEKKGRREIAIINNDPMIYYTGKRTYHVTLYNPKYLDIIKQISEEYSNKTGTNVVINVLDYKEL
jgi:hypothetical protein